MKDLLLVLGMMFCVVPSVSAQENKPDSVVTANIVVRTGEYAFPYDVVYEDTRSGCKISSRAGVNPGIEIVATSGVDSQTVRVTSSSITYTPRGSLARLQCRKLVSIIPDKTIRNTVIDALSM